MGERSKAHMSATLNGFMCIHICIYTEAHTHLCITVIVKQNTNLREQDSGEGSPLDYSTCSSLVASIRALESLSSASPPNHFLDTILLNHQIVSQDLNTCIQRNIYHRYLEVYLFNVLRKGIYPFSFVKNYCTSYKAVLQFIFI